MRFKQSFKQLFYVTLLNTILKSYHEKKIIDSNNLNNIMND